MIPKPFKGVISYWSLCGSVITGYAQYHINKDLHNENIHTSKVLKISHLNDDIAACETKNSYYILIGKQVL